MFTYKEKLIGTEEIIRHLFDPNYNNKFIPLKGKYLYLEHYLRSHWSEICGSALAKSCSVEKLLDKELVIRTANSMLANELYMMQGLFLQKINAFLLGSVIIKRLRFQSGAVIKKAEQRERSEAALPVLEYTKCPVCGGRMQKGFVCCSICEREQREQMRSKLAELLRIEPWLSYDDCRLYYQCDKIIFTAVKDNLKNYYYERVRFNYADKKECMMAVLFLLGKRPEEITTSAYENALTYLRSEQNVSTSGNRLHAKK